MISSSSKQAVKLLTVRPSSSSRSAASTRPLFTCSRASPQQVRRHSSINGDDRSLQRSTLPTTISSSVRSKHAATTSSQHYHQQQKCCRLLSSWQGHGTDLLSDSLGHSDVTGGDPLPKIILKAYGATGFDVVNSVKNMDPNDEDLTKSGGVIHYTGRSILAFPTSCFLWNVTSVDEFTFESLTPILLYQPSLEYLFIGSKEMIPPFKLQQIKQELEKYMNLDNNASAGNLVVEQMDVTNAMGTFNILNGEDRRVAAALILPPSK